MRMARRATANSSGANGSYFCGMAPAPDAAAGCGAGAGTGAGMIAAPLAGPGIAAAPEAPPRGAEAPSAGRSRMLPEGAWGRSFEE